jgi:hypothetical protein
LFYLPATAILSLHFIIAVLADELVQLVRAAVAVRNQLGLSVARLAHTNVLRRPGNALVALNAVELVLLQLTFELTPPALARSGTTLTATHLARTAATPAMGAAMGATAAAMGATPAMGAAMGAGARSTT